MRVPVERIQVLALNGGAGAADARTGVAGAFCAAGGGASAQAPVPTHSATIALAKLIEALK
jgi:hypothetical protein